MILDQPEPHLGGSEKMATAFFKMSRSIRRRSFSRRRREISDAESGAECGAGAGIGRSADPAFRPSLRLRQLRSIEGEIPSSLAICSNGRPLLASRAIASPLKRPPKAPDRVYPLVKNQEYAYAYDWEHRPG